MQRCSCNCFFHCLLFGIHILPLDILKYLHSREKPRARGRYCGCVSIIIFFCFCIYHMFFNQVLIIKCAFYFYKSHFMWEILVFGYRDSPSIEVIHLSLCFLILQILIQYWQPTQHFTYCIVCSHQSVPSSNTLACHK